jgi:hypothetical protein
MSDSSTSVIALNQITYPNIYIAETGTNLGRGVYASEDIPSGQIVETTPVVLLDLKAQPFPPQIRRLVYNWSKTQVALALGYGSLYNHSDQPNLIFTRITNNLSITFKALRDIEAGEQLTISYDYLGSGENPRDRSWFEIHGVDKVVIEAGENGN